MELLYDRVNTASHATFQVRFVRWATWAAAASGAEAVGRPASLNPQDCQGVGVAALLLVHGRLL